MTDSDWSRSARTRLALLLSRSPMRRSIVVLLLEGRSRKAIAVELQRSQHTIDSHLKAMYHAIGVGDRAQLMLMAQGLLGPEDPPPRKWGVDIQRTCEVTYICAWRPPRRGFDMLETTTLRTGVVKCSKLRSVSQLCCCLELTRFRGRLTRPNLRVEVTHEIKARGWAP